jgi:hypothetical protein
VVMKHSSNLPDASLAEHVEPALQYWIFSSNPEGINWLA